MLENKIPNLKHQIIYPVKLFDYWRDRVNYEDHILCLFRKSLQDDLTGQANSKYQYSMSKTFEILNLGHWDLFGI